jgi:3,4-dihydroxy-2-butanone 4-phosphate synthase
VIPAPIAGPLPGRSAAGRLASVEEAVAAIALGEMVVVVDSKDRENEGDLVMAAERVTPEAVNFMAIHGRGLICVPMLAERLEALGIPPMVRRNGDAHGTAFHVSVDHRDGATGISAADRAQTIRALADERTDRRSLLQPGHVFPLEYQRGGVLKRAGHTEASVDLTLMAGLSPAAVICEIASDDGTTSRTGRAAETGPRRNDSSPRSRRDVRRAGTSAAPGRGGDQRAGARSRLELALPETSASPFPVRTSVRQPGARAWSTRPAGSSG